MYTLKDLENDIEKILNCLIDTGFQTENELQDYFWNSYEDNIYCISKENIQHFKDYYFKKEPVEIRQILNKKITEIVSKIEHFSDSEYSDSE
jgi:hypothetical protein